MGGLVWYLRMMKIAQKSPLLCEKKRFEGETAKLSAI